MATLQELRQERLNKLEKLKELGIDPFPAEANRNTKTKQIYRNLEDYMNKDVIVSGMIKSIRQHSKVMFMDLKDFYGEIQLYIKNENMLQANYENSELNFSDLNLLDPGDFIDAYGKIIKTKTGTISVELTKLRILTKSIRPIPNQRDGLKDIETRFRRRYLDTKVNEDVKQRFIRKTKFWQAHRDFFRKNGFYEINIPVLEHIPGGGDANPFITHMNALDQDMYLRISQELPLKRLIGGGYEKVFEIGPRFRNEGLSDEHLPEHMAMEFYWAYADWKDGMEFVKDLFKEIIHHVYDDRHMFSIRGFEVDFSKDWEKIDFAEIIKERFGINAYKPDLEKIKKQLEKNNIKPDFKINEARGLDALWKLLRKEIAGPAFLINHPKFLSPLQKVSKYNPDMVERFQPIIAGSELGNGWSEVTDPIDQFERFSEQQKMRDAGDEEAQWLDIDYVEMLEYGMPPTFGYGHSERVFWFLEDVTAREGVMFPQLKFELSDTTKEIYNISEDTIGKGKESIYSTLSTFDKFKIDERTKEKWPSLRVGYAEIEGVKIQKVNEELEKLKKKELRVLTKDQIENLKPIQSYRKLYKETGVKLGSRKPSPEALLTRLSKGEDLYIVNTCVDAYNLVVMKYGVSIGAFDADNIKGKVILKTAEGTEEIQLLGKDEKTQLKEGELCYFDEKGPYNLDFNYRDAVRTSVSTNTKNLIINVDGVYDITRSDVEKSLKESVELITRFCGGTVKNIGIIE